MKHALTTYREAHNLTLEAFGAIVGATKSAVLKWEAGAMPRAETLRRITEHTGGALTANDFVACPSSSQDAAA